ncbi:putative inorganic diphosphatase [Dioscorea sansibarensis]
MKHRSSEGFSGEILSRSARHDRNNSDVVSGAGVDQTSPTHQWPQATTNPSDPLDAPVALAHKQPARPKSRFQDDPQSQLDGRKDLVLSPPRVLVETAHRRSISSSTCSLEKLGGDKGLLSSRGRRSVSRELEPVGRHLDMVVDDDVMQINSFLKRQRALIARIGGTKVFANANANAKILLSASSGISMASSMVATIGYAWLLENMENREGGGRVVVPVMNLKRRSMHKHRQVAWLFHYLGIDASALLFSDEVDLDGLVMSNQFSILVTGQDVLNTNNEVGSICTILTDNYCEHAYELLQTPNMKKLLLAGILLDTRNLDKSSKFHTHRDAEATQLLLVGSVPGLRQELFEQLIQDHKDNLFLEALKRNYGNPSCENNDENGALQEHKIPISKSTSRSPHEEKPKHIQVLAPIQKLPTPAPAPEPTPAPAPRGKNRFFLAKWFGFGSR